MNIAIAMVVKQQQQKDILRHLENEQLVRQARMAHQQEAKATKARNVWHQIIAAVLPG